MLDGAESITLPVISGGPQGSILGPFLFLIYIDKVANCISSSIYRITMYANDIGLYQEISTQSGHARIQKGVDSLCVWIANNRLKQNAATLPSQGNMCPHCQISLFILRVTPSSLELTSSNTWCYLLCKAKGS